jgi:ATP-dependent helicase/nuclease subunit A
MAVAFEPEDQDARRRIRESLDETLFVEAGAGTGKTTSLVERIVSLISTGRTTLDRLAAITFTEAAAAELRDRIREGLERASTDEKRGEEERRRCRQGVDDLDHASIQTLHSFAARLLQERPLEAGLPPAFEVMDAISGELAFEERWSKWLDSALDDTTLAPILALAFSLGLTTEHLRYVAERFHYQYDLLAGASFENVPRPRPSAARAVVEAAPELERLCAFSRLEDDDRLYSHIRGLLGSVRRLVELDPASHGAYRLLQRILPVRCSVGKKEDWEDDPHSGQNACTRLKALLKELDERVRDELSQVRRYALMPLLQALQKLILEYAEERKRQGQAEFHDLLVWARDLLRDDLDVRDSFRYRFTHLLIDEAQDTDPIQAEIALFLAEDVPESTPPGARPRAWTEVRPAPGKLFVVGDPKQSIYRFRRADVRQMMRLRELLGRGPVRLSQDFRFHQPVLDWVNHVFQQWMQEGSGQTEYTAITHRWQVATDHPARPMTWSLGEAQEDNTISPVRRNEAQAIASLLRTVVDGGWQALDVEAARKAGEERYRTATYSDICILMPQRTALRTLELAMDETGIPYRLEGASLIFGTQEVKDLINCLRTIDDPSDQVALVAALRSPAFACSDEDLLRFVEAGGKLDYLSENIPPLPKGRLGGVEATPSNSPFPRGRTDFLSESCVADGPVARALSLLKYCYQERLWTSIASLVDRFIREQFLMEAALGYPRPREQWRRYRFIVEQARAFAAAGGNSLRAFLDWIDRQASEGARVTEVPVPEGDEEAVRVMTVHAAKGLEFPVVVLTGLNSDPSPRVDGVLFDRDSGAVEVRLGGGDNAVTTPGYDDLAQLEKDMEEQEYVRLLYVAATRARDHLVISMYRTTKKLSQNS